MRYLNQLEPSSLIRHFAEHLPQGFVALGAHANAVPGFAASFDLLTTADESLKRRVASLPGYQRWAHWLRIDAAFIGTTVSEYTLLPATSTPNELAAAWRSQLAHRFALLIVKDIPQRSPLLDEMSNTHADALVAACEREGFVLIEGQALAYVPIDFPDINAYLANLSASRRKNLRRKLRSRAALQIRRISTGDDAFKSQEVIDAYYALYLQVYAQSEVHFDRLSRDFFAAVVREAGSGGIVFEYRAAGELIGWNLCFESGGKLIDKYIGFQYPQARAHNLYFVSWMVNLEYAIERHLTHYVAGWTDPEVKAQLGAQFTFTRHAVYIRNSVLRALGRRFASRFENDRQWQSHKELHTT